ncbi:MAG: hypothetical protein C0624_03940 [Desulfuromonas sp.]|nr:MAG: hypothetical protein C0624_03940 [Desulfuromonas sp.]
MIRSVIILACLFFALPALAVQDFYVGTNRLEQLRGELLGDIQQGETCQIVSVSGLIEVESSYEIERNTTSSDNDAFDLVLDEARLGLDIRVNEWASGSVAFSYQEELDHPELDEATINLNYKLLHSRIGRQFLPLGMHRTELVSDPLVRLFGETRSTALSLGVESSYLNVSGFLLRSNYDDSTDVSNRLHDWGGQLQLSLDERFELGAAYLNDLAETDFELLETPYSKRVGAWSGWLRVNTPHLKVRGELFCAAQRFASLDLDHNGDGDGDRPLAWLTEIAFPLTPSLEGGLRLEGSDELLDFPERQYGVDISWAILSGTTLSLEALHAEFDPTFTTDSKLEKRDKLTLQMAVSF